MRPTPFLPTSCGVSRVISSRFAGLILLTALALSFLGPAFAFETRVARGDNSAITVAAGEKVDDTLLAVADTVNIDGIVTGNLIALGRRVTVKGTVEGDLICAAQDAELYGTVRGNALSFSRRVDVRGPVAGSLHAFAEDVQLDSGARIDADVVAFGSEVTTDGVVGRDLLTFAGLTEIRGTVGRDLIARTGRLSLQAAARVEGDMTAHVGKQEDVVIDSGATVLGQRDIRVSRAPAPRSRFARPGFYFWQAVRFGAAFLTGLLLFWLFPSLVVISPESTGAALRTMGIGFVALVAIPVAAIVAAVTLVGLPIGLFGLGSWLAGLYVASIVVAVFLGRAILKRPAEQMRSPTLALLLGLAILFLAFAVPYLGVAARFLAVLLGLGTLVSELYSRWEQRRAA